MMYGHMGETYRWNTSAVHNIVRFRYQRMNVTILYLKGYLVKSLFIPKYALENVSSLRSYF